MGVAVPIGYPTFPEVAQMHTARPVYGATASLLMDTANHLAGFRFRPVCCLFAEGEFYHSGGSTWDTAPATMDVWHRFHTSPLARYLYVRIEYMSPDASGTPTAQMTATIEDTAGVVKDVGVIWAQGAGTLKATHHQQAFTTGTQEIASTGTLVELTSPGAATRPRLLNLEAGADRVLHLACVNVRVGSVSAWELYEATLP